jgi:5-methylcytosine-specific restriction endonuclease McrA
MVTKTCSKCDIEKDVSEYYTRKDRKSGYNSRCKICVCIESNAYNSANKEAKSIYGAKYYEENKVLMKENNKQWVKDNPAKVAAKSARHYRNNREASAMYSAKNYADNRERRQAQCKLWRQANPSKSNAYSATRRAAKINRTLELTPAHRAEIDGIYLYAKIFSQVGQLHVDHIVPLRGVTISGLHTPWNLQVIPAVENLQKSNTFISE